VPTSDEQGEFNMGETCSYVHDLSFQIGLVWVRLNKRNTSLPKSMDNYVNYRTIDTDDFYASIFVDKMDKREISGTCYFHDAKGELYSETAMTISTYDDVKF